MKRRNDELEKGDQMEFTVKNENICVGQISVMTLGAASVVKVGDGVSVQLFSVFDTPPESILSGTLTPVAPASGIAIR